mgnify:FL=1
MGIKKNLVKNQQSGGKKSNILINNNNHMKGTLYMKKDKFKILKNKEKMNVSGI